MQVVHKTVPTRSRRICSVGQCSNYCSEKISLHRFPKDPKLCQMWKVILKIGKPISKFMFVCSEHFLEGDFMPITPLTTRKRLKQSVVPSQKLPVQPQLRKLGTYKKHRNHLIMYPIEPEPKETRINQKLPEREDRPITVSDKSNEDTVTELSTALVAVPQASVSHSYSKDLDPPLTIFRSKATQTDFYEKYVEKLHYGTETLPKTNELEVTIFETVTRTGTCDAVDGFLLRVGEGLRRLSYAKRSRLEIKFLKLLQQAAEENDDEC